MVIITFKDYVRPRDLDEALALNSKKRNHIVGGMLWQKMSSRNYGTVIDLCDLGLDTIEETDEAFRIGAMVTLGQLMAHEGFGAYTCGAVRDAFQGIVGVQFRNLATVGGSLWRRMGFSDVVTLFLVMDAQVELARAGSVALADFVGMPFDDDIIVALTVRKTPATFAYQVVRKQSTDLPSLNACAAHIDGTWRVAIGARPLGAMLVTDERRLLAGGVTEEIAVAFADYVAEVVPVGANSWGSKAWRQGLARTLTKRALMRIATLEEKGGAA